MALKIERFVCPGKGNGLRATHDIRAGELLYKALPLASCVSRKHMARACHHCFIRAESLLRCSKCKTARYCNAQCQRQAWLVHKVECGRLKALLPTIPPDSVRQAARILQTMQTPTSQNAPEELYSIEEHQSHLEGMSEEKLDGLRHLSSALQLYLQEGGEGHTHTHDLLSLLAKITCNCFTISDGELQEVGVGLYPSMSLLNHDCQPNCVMLFEGTTLHLRAVRDIKTHQEVTISYAECVSPTAERRGQLEQQYHFTCQCRCCSNSHRDAEMLAGGVRGEKLKEALPDLEKLQAELKWSELLSSGVGLLEQLGGGAVPDSNVYLLRLLDLLLDCCVSIGRYDTALAYGTRTLQPYSLYYPDPHPARGLQLMRVGKLQHLQGRVEEAMHTFTQAYDVIKVTHGRDHSLTAELQGRLAECQAELNRD
ncbi:histone-lysine N-methyltransferase SMYD3 [Engraulis encrasicolus]|uniref:histone-lysine N-methyltransferase SMYD3 n=1 Tax=Engraulis encrasicolus TaxID=184585 RepID=UPI002FD61F79